MGIERPSPLHDQAVVLARVTFPDLTLVGGLLGHQRFSVQPGTCSPMGPDPLERRCAVSGDTEVPRPAQEWVSSLSDGRLGPLRA